MKKLETSKTKFINFALSNKAYVYKNCDKEKAEQADKYFQRKIRKMVSLGIFDELERMGFCFENTSARQSKENYATPAILCIISKNITKSNNMFGTGNFSIGMKYSLQLVSSADWTKRFDVPTDLFKVQEIVLKINGSRGW